MSIRKPLVQVVVSSLLFIGALHTPSRSVNGEEPVEKLAVPDPATGQHAAKAVREIFGDEISAAKTSGEKSAVARKLLQAGIDEQKDMAGRFELFMLARDLAVEAGDPDVAFKAIVEMSRHYQIDAMEMRCSAAKSLSRTASTPAAREGLLTRMDPLIDEAMAADRFDVAECAIDAIRASGNPTAVKRATIRANEIRTAETTYAAMKPALATLANAPSDPGANLIVGQYLCLTKADWEAGLPRLALGSDEKLQMLAKQDLARPTEVEAEVALADRWWQLAEEKPEPWKTRLKYRAATWYRRALPGLAGLEKARAEKRCDEAANAIALASGTAFPLEMQMNDPMFVKTYWTLQGNWRFTKFGLDFPLTHDTPQPSLQSTYSFDGDVEFKMEFEQPGKNVMFVSMWGERFEIRSGELFSLGRRTFSIRRSGNTITARLEGKEPHPDKPLGFTKLIALPENRKGSPTKITIDYAPYPDNQGDLLILSIQAHGGRAMPPNAAANDDELIGNLNLPPRLDWSDYTSHCETIEDAAVRGNVVEFLSGRGYIRFDKAVASQGTISFSLDVNGSAASDTEIFRNDQDGGPSMKVTLTKTGHIVVSTHHGGWRDLASTSSVNASGVTNITIAWGNDGTIIVMKGLVDRLSGSTTPDNQKPGEAFEIGTSNRHGEKILSLSQTPIRISGFDLPESVERKFQTRSHAK